MATVLNTSILGNFGVIFTFLFAWVLVYAMLLVTNIFGDKKNLNSIIALAVAVLVLMSPAVAALISFMIPWLLVLALVVFFILFGTKMFAGDKPTGSLFMNKRTSTWIIIGVLVIFIFGLGKAFGSSALQSGQWNGTSNASTVSSGSADPTGLENTNVDGSQVATSDFSTNVLHTIFHPKVLGIILILLVGVFALFFLAD